MASTDTVVGGDPTVVINNVSDDQIDTLPEIIEHLPALIKEAKSGYKTTEFWITIVTSLLVVVNAVPMPEKYEGFVVAALGIAYALSRGIAKKGVPNMEADPAAIAPVDEIVQREEGEKFA